MTDTKKVLTEKQSAFLHHLSNDAKGDIRLAMDLAGYSKTTNQHEVIGSLKDEIIDITKDFMAANGLKAMSKLVGVLDSPNQLGASNIINAAKEVLDRAGVGKKLEQDVNIKFDGVIILPAKGSVQALPENKLPIIDLEVNPSPDPVLIDSKDDPTLILDGSSENH